MVFKSRLEKQIALPVLVGLVLPLLLGALVVSRQLTDQALVVAEERLKRDAKDAGMLLLSELRQAFHLPQHGAPEVRSKLRLADAFELALDTGNGTQTLPISDLASALKSSSPNQICIGWPEHPCAVPADALSARWRLRLVSLFDTNLAFDLVAIQPRSEALGHVLLGTRLLPLILLGLLFGALSFVLRAIRRHMQPVPEISAALRQLEGGDRRINLAIDANNEFASLGTALNELSGDLEAEFAFRDAVSRLDDHILLAQDLPSTLRLIEQTALAFCTVTDVTIEPSGESAAWAYLAPGTQTQTADGAIRLPITSGEERWGTLTAQAAGTANLQRLELLARRASVAVTSAANAQELLARATYDSLTGLLNRASFRSVLEDALRRPDPTHGTQALLFLDLDRFKLLNDTQGHSHGDKLLRGVADRLRETVGPKQRIARFGGDEFALLLDGTVDSELVERVKGISAAIAQPIRIDSYTHKIDSSIGICRLGQDGNDAETLLKNADIAMYAAKAEPGSTYRFFNESLNAAAARRLRVETRLRQALQTGALDVHFQPKLNTNTRRLSEAEALLRWHDEELGQVNPAEFIPLAEQGGLIVALTDLVIERAGALLRAHAAETLNRIAVNLSPIQLATADCVQHLLEVIDAQQVARSRFQIEVTESVMIDNPRTATERLIALQEAGLSIALDDFGTGYSSLNLLTRLPIDYLKIDKSFVDTVPGNPQSTLLIRKVVEMADGLGIATIAEGVEHQAQLDALCAMGVSQIQGYLVSRPLDRTAFQQLLSSPAVGGSERPIAVQRTSGRTVALTPY